MRQGQLPARGPPYWREAWLGKTEEPASGANTADARVPRAAESPTPPASPDAGPPVQARPARRSRRRLADRPAEQEIVLGLERLGRQSVEEMRGLVGILRERVSGESPAPAPSLSRVHELIAGVRAAGLPVRCEVPDDLPELPPVLGRARVLNRVLRCRHRLG